MFISETRNQNGGKYPPKTVYSLLTGILHLYASRNYPNYPNCLKKNSPIFSEFGKTLEDNIFKNLRMSGVGAEYIVHVH